MNATSHLFWPETPWTGRQGVGRSGLIAATVLAMGGVNPDDGFARLTAVRGVAVPETEPQRRWLNEMAPTLRAA